MGRAVHDIDLIVSAGALSLTFWLAEELGYPAFILDSDREVGRIILPTEGMTIDFAIFRGPSLEDDLRDRDFTINALALPLDGDSIADVIDINRGQEDLAAGRIQVIHERSIADDPIRALRAARLAIDLGFDVTADTRTAIQAVVPLLTLQASPERIRNEISRLLILDEPHRGFMLLHELGLLAAVLPQIAALDGVTQSSPHHEDVLRHTMSVLRYCAAIDRLLAGEPGHVEWSDPVAGLITPYRAELNEHLNKILDGGYTGRLLLRWGGLFHDAGKPLTRTIDDGGKIRFFGHEVAGDQIVDSTLSSFGLSNEAVRRVRKIVYGHMRPLHLAKMESTPNRRAVFRYFKALGEAGLDVGLLALADHLATCDGIGPEASWNSLLEVINTLYAAYFNENTQTIAPPRLLDGREVMTLLSIPQGQEVGRILDLLVEAQAAGEISFREEAVAFILAHGA